jgi:hypothetical protein
MKYKRLFKEQFDEQQFFDHFRTVYKDLLVKLSTCGFKTNSYLQLRENTNSIQVFMTIFNCKESKNWWQGPQHKLGIIISKPPEDSNMELELTEKYYVTKDGTRYVKNYFDNPMDMLGFITL